MVSQPQQRPGNLGSALSMWNTFVNQQPAASGPAGSNSDPNSWMPGTRDAMGNPIQNTGQPNSMAPGQFGAPQPPGPAPIQHPAGTTASNVIGTNAAGQTNTTGKTAAGGLLHSLCGSGA